VLLNLLTNAIKFTQDGTVTIYCQAIPVLKPQRLYVEVVDTGVGIPRDKINCLFDQFYKVEDTHNLNPNGIGLGLFICKHVVEGCGG
jgi:signal transduction histidine kinase